MFGFCGKVRYVKILFFWKICIYTICIIYTNTGDIERHTEHSVSLLDIWKDFAVL